MAALNLSRQKIGKHLSKPGAPQPDAEGRYDVSAVRKFVAGEQRNSRGYATGDLTKARIAKLELECKELRLKLHEGLPSVPVPILEEYLWRFLNELNKEQQSVVNMIGLDLVNKQNVADVYKVLRPMMLEIQWRLAAWCRDNGIPVRGGAKFDWPVEGHPSFNLGKKNETQTKVIEVTK